MDLAYQSLARVSDLLSTGDTTSVELTEACLSRISSSEPQVNAFITISTDLAMQQATNADIAWQNWRNGKSQQKPSPLNGVPLAIKDVICVSDVVASAGSMMLKEFVPPYDSTASECLRDAGAIFLGKTNTDEFAMGSSTENSAFGPTHNPWDLKRVPGGSSGGSAAAVAAGMTFGALGTDTGGSVRQPAAMCGVVGLKPTYGRVSRYGLIAFGSSLDQIGTLTRTVEDAALLLQTISGPDLKDATTLQEKPPDYLEMLSKSDNLNGVRVGVEQEHIMDSLQPEVEKSVKDVIKMLNHLGAEVVPVQLPHTKHALEAYYLIANAEASANLARYDGIRFGQRSTGNNLRETYINTRSNGFGKEVKRRIMLGTYALTAGYYEDYYLNAQKVRTLVQKDFATAFSEVDIIVGPVTPTTAFNLGEKIEDPLQMYLSDIFTLSGNLAGIPGISLPCGFDHSGLPIGVQLLGPARGEQQLLAVAHIYQQATDWHKHTPPLEH